MGTLTHAHAYVDVNSNVSHFVAKLLQIIPLLLTSLPQSG